MEIAAIASGGNRWRTAARTARRAWRGVRWPISAVLIVLGVLVQSALVAVWALPFDPALLRPASEPLVILDRQGRTLATVVNPAGYADRDHWVPLADIPAIAQAAVVETEDQDFWEHRGVDARGIARAAWLDLRAGRAAFGGSTLTMQLARMIAAPGEPRSWTLKLDEGLLALRIERAVDKRAILEQWMNRASFGHGAFGIEAGARRYFGKPAAGLTTGEAVLLALIAHAPAQYDPIAHPEATARRRDEVIDLLLERGLLTRADASQARAEPIPIAPREPSPGERSLEAWIVSRLPAPIRARGGVVHTTIDASGLAGPLAAIIDVTSANGDVWRPSSIAGAAGLAR